MKNLLPINENKRFSFRDSIKFFQWYDRTQNVPINKLNAEEAWNLYLSYTIDIFRENTNRIKKDGNILYIIPYDNENVNSIEDKIQLMQDIMVVYVLDKILNRPIELRDYEKMLYRYTEHFSEVSLYFDNVKIGTMDYRSEDLDKDRLVFFFDDNLKYKHLFI